MALFDLELRPSSEPSAGSKPDQAGRKARVRGWVLLVLMGILAFFFARAIRHIENDLTQQRRQTEEIDRRLNEVEKRSQTEAQQAPQAAANAQAAAARQEASQAEQKAEEYRQQREQELAHLQQVLSHIADTRRTANGLVVTLSSNSIRFDFDKSDIKPPYREILSRIAGVLMSVEGYSIHIFGYTDDVGTQDYNLKLSERRAQAVRDYLVESGLDPKIITTKGYGKSDPRVPGDRATARATNRRVEIGIVDTTLRLEGPAN